MFRQDVVDAVTAAANANGVDPATMLAVIEVETAGVPFESDGVTPRFLFERHVFFKQTRLRSRALQATAIAKGLAIPKWNKKTQYSDERNTADRIKLIAKARAVDEDAANESASWGLSQIMGFHYKALGFPTATAMVSYMSTGGVAAQVECFVRLLKHMGLMDELQRSDFAGFAVHYNGSGYKQNAYDTKMAVAKARWKRKLANGGGIAKPVNVALVQSQQEKLKSLGYTEVGSPDGDYGTRTVAAVAAFQAHEGLPVTGQIDEDTHDTLMTAAPRPVSEARENATVDDLRAAGSQQVATGDQGSLVSKVVVGVGALGGAEKTGALEKAQGMLDQANSVRTVVDGAHDIMGWLAQYWWVGAIVAGVVGYKLFGNTIKRRLVEHRTAMNVGV